MKLIEAMKRVKQNKEKIASLQTMIGNFSAHLSHETPVYGTETPEKINGWAQTCEDLAQDNIKLLTAISRTNLATQVTVTLGEKRVTKTIAEWIWRRREYATSDLLTYQKMGDRGLREGHMPSSVPGGTPIEVKLVRNYNPERRDKKLAEYQSEPHEIDATLEVTNAVTDLLE
jgi:hypothetical protein